MLRRGTSETPASESSEATFDRISESYHALLDESLSSTGESSEYFAHGRIAWTADRLREVGVQPERILDFGCGTGSSAPLLRRRFGSVSLVGVDVSSASIELARSTYGGEDTVFVAMADFQPQPDSDLIYCNGVIHHVPPGGRPATLRLVLDSLRPGGIFALWENNPWNPGTRFIMSRCEFDRDAIPLSSREARGLLTGAGFDVLRTDYLFIFPRSLAALRPIERLVARWPLGGQYMVLARKP